MKTDNKTTNKTEYAEMVRASIAPHILSEAASHTFEKRSSRVSTWAAVACFALIFAAAAIFLFKPKTERLKQALVGTSPKPTFTPAPTPDIRNMPIIYGRADCIPIDDIQHRAGTVTLYGGLDEMLADEQYNSCVFAVDIDIQDRYLENMYSNMYSEEFDKLYKEFQNDPAVVRYNELYEGFVQDNADRYYELLEEYFYPSEFHGDFQTREEELEAIAEKYDESMVFSVAFGYYLESTGQEQSLSDYAVAQDEYNKMRSELFKEQESNPVDAELKSRHEAEVQRLKDCSLVSEIYEFGGETMLYWLLTRDQLLNFPASPEFAYIITPALDPEAAPEPTEAPDGIAVDEAQVEHIINLLAEYHAAQFSRSAQVGELKLSENVLSDLEQRQRCIEEMDERIGKLDGASVTVDWLGILPTYSASGEIKSYIVSYCECTAINYTDNPPLSGGGTIHFDVPHTVTIAADGTVLHDYFSEYDVTGFSNHPFLGNGIVWTDSEVPMSYYASERYQYLAAANELLAGEIPSRTEFRYYDQYVRFRFDGDALKAYVTVPAMITAPGTPHTDDEMSVTVAMIPREVGELAYRRLIEYWDANLGLGGLLYDPEAATFEGFVGENWFALVTPDDSVQDLQVHCIFYFDGNDWREIIGNNGGVLINGSGTPLPTTVFGASVLDENTAMLCYYTRGFFAEGSDDGKIYIYRTENGGESWSRLDIVLPEFFNELAYYAPLSPVFDESGINGVIILDNSYQLFGWRVPFSWLESHDGGQSWEYRSLDDNA
ncbi:MAG: hypothetical protein IKZ82_02550 [Clostridia bacterium]|nr:hypothetical protein [Clostridia bacterium]